ncbi:hypothetical protein D3C83_10720 [compost metagenome]
MHFLGFFDHGNIEVDDDRFLPASHQHAGERFIVVRIDFLVRHIGRHVNEVPGPRLGDEFEPVAPPHAGAAADHIDHAFDGTVVVGAGLGLGMDDDRAGPEFFRARARVGNGRGTVHAGRLRRVDVELVAMHDPHAVITPFGFGGVFHRASSVFQ